MEAKVRQRKKFHFSALKSDSMLLRFVWSYSPVLVGNIYRDEKEINIDIQQFTFIDREAADTMNSDGLLNCQT